jgi:hypothetical protein
VSSSTQRENEREKREKRGKQALTIRQGDVYATSPHSVPCTVETVMLSTS